MVLVTTSATFVGGVNDRLSIRFHLWFLVTLLSEYFSVSVFAFCFLNLCPLITSYTLILPS